MIYWHLPAANTVAKTAPGTSGNSAIATILMIVILCLFAVVLLFFLGLIVQRLISTRREQKLEAKRKVLSPIVRELLAGDRTASEVAAALEAAVSPRDRALLEQVLLEEIRALEGQERHLLSGVFDELGFVDEDIANLSGRGLVGRAQAAFHLGIMRSTKAVPALILALDNSRQKEVTFSCLNALSKIGSRPALDAVVGYLASSPALETMRVSEVILERKGEFDGSLARWLERNREFAGGMERWLDEHGDPDVDRVLLLVNILGAMEDPQVVPLLRRFLENDDARVRASAAFSLGLTGDLAAGDYLAEALEDESAEVRAKSAEALGKLRCESAIPALRQGLHDDDLFVKVSCAVALSRLGEEGNDVLQSSLPSIEEATRALAAEAADAGKKPKDSGSSQRVT